MICRLFVVWLAMVCALASPALAQTADERPLRRIDVEVGGGLLGGAGLGTVDANLLANDPVRQPLRLFTTEGRFMRAPALIARVGWAFSRRLGVEGGLVMSRPTLRTSLSRDAEGAAPLTIDQRVDQYFVEGSVVIMIDEWRMGRRTVPFAAAGIGYLRQLNEGVTVIEGHMYQAGGGVKHWLMTRDRGRLRAAGLRADARWYLLAEGLAFDEDPRSHVAISGSVFVSF